MSDELEEINLNLKSDVIDLCEANYDDTLDGTKYILKCRKANNKATKNISYDDCKEYIKSDVELYLVMRDYLKWKKKEEFNGVYDVVNMYIFVFRSEYLMGAAKIILFQKQMKNMLGIPFAPDSSSLLPS